MKICNKCGTQLVDEAAFCSNCGSSLEENFKESDIICTPEEMDTTILEENFDRIPPVSDEINQHISEDKVSKTNQNAVPPQYVNPAFNSVVQQPPIQTQQNYYNPVQPQANINLQYNIQGEKLSYDEFYKRIASKKTKNNAIAVGIICILTAVVALGVLGMTTNPLAVIDIIFYGVFAGLVLKKKQWGFTLPVCIYGGIFTIIDFVIYGTPSGILAFVISIIATISLKKVDDAYKQYLATNQFPQIEI